MGSSYKIIQAGDSRSFDGPHPFVDNSDPQGAARVFIGQHAGSAFAAAGPLDACPFIAIELGQECLGEHTGEDGGREGSNVLGLARFRLGSAPPTALVELVRQPQTRPAAIAAARAALTAAGLKVAICGDFPGRIVDRLIRPYLNAALRRLHERLGGGGVGEAGGGQAGPVPRAGRTGLCTGAPRPGGQGAPAPGRVQLIGRSWPPGVCWRTGWPAAPTKSAGRPAMAAARPSRNSGWDIASACPRPSNANMSCSVVSKLRAIRVLARPMTSAGPAARRAASCRPAASSCSSGTTRATRPSSSASLARIVAPPNRKFFARAIPMSRGSWYITPMSGIVPGRKKPDMNGALVPAITTSPVSAKPMPPPTA